MSEENDIRFLQPNRDTGEVDSTTVRTNDLVIADKQAVSANSQRGSSRAHAAAGTASSVNH